MLAPLAFSRSLKNPIHGALKGCALPAWKKGELVGSTLLLPTYPVPSVHSTYAAVMPIAAAELAAPIELRFVKLKHRSSE